MRSIKELNNKFNKLLKNQKVLCYLRLKSYLSKNEIEYLVIILGFLKHGIEFSIDNLEKYIRCSKLKEASLDEIEEYFKIFELDDVYEKNILYLIEILTYDPIVFLHKLKLT